MQQVLCAIVERFQIEPVEEPETDFGFEITPRSPLRLKLGLREQVARRAA